ncbi:malto-oligosyltrehalose synthase [Pseudoclavibacter sp. RFBJ3]|nr:MULTISPECIES: malto-oligosyltrehalose synthase [unclassified Pseudoclavibacter]PPF85526.1 malto-oligosyltrehalose synthase [Pseudoclavibacter sp. RFBJ5]PPF93340.1 malto-oligosyltrehalose synthase [Pseudoclavibacter sp. RFBJ3]PPF99242.1 malto-oligosyltrehalose synthase [Pseudoclavibacter sp. RFBH5]PPG25521.1 malto-oligosyltrehalose synthase [Pseudoclavibacter sp. RFBI4]
MRIPSSTYRFQLTSEFDLDAATEQLPYLERLGVGWVYLSPILQATPGSTHGYDVVDPSRVDDERGGREGLERFSAKARELGLGVLVDIVPNHMGVGTPRDNPWWWDVLEHGQQAAHAESFDIDWEAGGGKLLIPTVGDDDMPRERGDAIANVTVDTEAGVLRYHSTEYPLAEGSAPEGASVREVLDNQHYQLIHWRQGDSRLNYRRFFTITSLAGIRVEDEHVFEEAHAEILDWMRHRLVDGLRIDHPDGLRDPGGYLRHLADRTRGAYVLVEKILEGDEALPADWRTAGTTGYDALGQIDRVLVDADAEEPLDELAAGADGDPVDWEQLIHEAKRAVADVSLNAEIRRIARELRATGLEDDLIEDSVAEIAAHFSVYRSYLPTGANHLADAARAATEQRPDLAASIARVLPFLEAPEAEAALRLQQTTGMIMAKAVEDRSFYRYARLTSLNEVGGDPNVFSITPERFHELQTARARDWPDAMTTLSTHDTKRGEDTRARITALSEVPEFWAESVAELQNVAPIDDNAFAQLTWQAIVGAWPASRERLTDYLEKAAREADLHTSWTNPDETFEGQLHAAVDAVFDNPVASNVVQNVVAETQEAGWSNSLTAKIVQLTMPGIPDVYQGTELWTRTLVDPDNRQSVDYSSRTAALDAILHGAVPAIDDSGAAKLLVTAACLRLRRSRPELFTEYEGITADGPAAEHALAFSRGGAITIGTRLPIGLEQGGGWIGTTIPLPEGEWIDQLTAAVFTGGKDVPLAALLQQYPVALLARS